MYAVNVFFSLKSKLMKHIIKSNYPQRDKLLFGCVLNCHVALSLVKFLIQRWFSVSALWSMSFFLDYRGRDRSPRADSGRHEEEERCQLASFYCWRQSSQRWNHVGPAAGNTDPYWWTTSIVESILHMFKKRKKVFVKDTFRNKIFSGTKTAWMNQRKVISGTWVNVCFSGVYPANLHVVKELCPDAICVFGLIFQRCLFLISSTVEKTERDLHKVSAVPEAGQLWAAHVGLQEGLGRSQRRDARSGSQGSGSGKDPVSSWRLHGKR